MKLTKKEILSIPNIMGYFRILLIPVIVWKLLSAQDVQDYRIAAVLVGISGITDTLDGLVARKFHMVTELGKALDPVADKLTQLALVFCLATRYFWMIPIVILLIVKEGFMGVMGLVMLRHNGRKLDGAKWYGKVCTAVLYFAMFLLIVFPELPDKAVNGMIGLCAAVLLFSLSSYIPVYRRMWNGE